ncbi:MAG: preprotein translocase subunit YajC [Nocardioidaceae bacterium]
MKTAESLLPLVLVIALAYFVFIRPARRRAQETRAVQSALTPGDRVMLTSGIYGTISSVDEQQVHIEIAPGVVVATHRAAVAQVIRDEPDASTTPNDPYSPGAAGTGAAEPPTPPDTTTDSTGTDSRTDDNRGAN